ncbi:hypothetical protein D3OALGA1CA_5640 [Olavius algarvensis associated proteobacterium Delta 3]|nr:hypothetical protein D3OALGA1CA_5640 [Olavius algarvensis associated proteobacterium Delta 3]
MNLSQSAQRKTIINENLNVFSLRGLCELERRLVR